MKESEQKSLTKRSFDHIKIPHAFVLISGIIILSWIATYILPAGQFAREKVLVGETVRSVLIPGTYHSIPSSPASFMDLASAFYVGLIQAADVVFLIFFAYSCFTLVVQTGALDSFIHVLLKKVEGKEWAFIIVFCYLFSLGGSMLGMLSEFYGFIPIFISLAIAMGYDRLVGFSIVNFSSHIGFAAATTNPFTVGVAQIVSQVPLLSGLEFRFVLWFVFTTLTALYILWYARRIKKDPSKSVLAGTQVDKEDYEIDLESHKPITFRDILVLFIVVVSLGVLIYGTLRYKWGMKEIVGIFFTMAIFSGFAAGWNANRIAEQFVTGCRGIVYGALITGLARGILLILQQGNIIDTVMFYASNLFEGLSPWISLQAMFFFQAIVNFFIPSGSGQAATTMPIMSGFADLTGITRQTAILAFQFGDGIFNLVWPTGGIIVTCALAKIPLEKWWKFLMPFLGISVIAVMITLTVAMYIGF